MSGIVTGGCDSSWEPRRRGQCARVRLPIRTNPNPLLKVLSNPMAANPTPKMINTMPLVDPLPLPVAMSACPGWFGSYRTTTVSPWYELQAERTKPGSLADRCCAPTWKDAIGSQVCEVV